MNTNEPKKRTAVADVVAVNTQLLQRIDSLEQQQQVAVRPVESKVERDWKMARAIAGATVIPKRFQNEQANVFVAMEIADRMQIGVFEVMQNLNIINGSPAWTSSYAIGRANQFGPFRGPIAYELDGPGQSVTAYATIRETGDRVEYTVSMAMAKADGWTKNAKYQSMPMHMLRFRAAVLLIRTTCPEVLLGGPSHTVEEIEDVKAAKQASSNNRIEALNNLIVAAPEPAPEPEPIEAKAVAVEPEPEPEAGNREFF